MNLFREAADIKTADQLNLPTPTAVYHTEVTQPTALQKQMVQELSERAAKVHAGSLWTQAPTICSRSPRTDASWALTSAW